MSLSGDIFDNIDGAEESRGHDGRISAWGRRAEHLEWAVRFAREMARWSISGVNPTQSIHDVRDFLKRTEGLADSTPSDVPAENIIMVALIREARDLMREALDDVCGQISPSDAEDWITRAMDACSQANPRSVEEKK